ncbi:DUF6572 domain-containing protein [Paraburkholderia tropica]|uniref:DUF6572 domain-containing protein n=1 Tax=Paraburkholderia tropica TaxID=92647 RepID=UPI002AB305C1|nr:DUF6572 domain-containing protein [Paraburkholderia tropica]
MNMSILDKNVVDIIGVNAEKGVADLFMTDHLEWDDEVNEHLYILQEKINCYLKFLENGELLTHYPHAKDCKPAIVIEMMYEPPAAAIEFINKAREIVRGAGFDLRYAVIPPKH